MQEQSEQWASVLTLAQEVRALRQHLQRLNTERAQILRERARILSRFPASDGEGGLQIHALLRSAARWEQLGSPSPLHAVEVD